MAGRLLLQVPGLVYVDVIYVVSLEMVFCRMQYNTMQMMYEIIYKALVEVGLDKTYEPQDYLNFFCLGTREAPDNATNSNSKSSTANTPQVCLVP